MTGVQTCALPIFHDRRRAVARLHQEDAAKMLFQDIAPGFKDRPGGYTRIIRLHERQGDAAQRAILEWVDFEMAVEPEPPKSEPKAKKEGGEKKAETTT